MNKMPSVVDDEKSARNRRNDESTDSKVQVETVCKFDSRKPTHLDFKDNTNNNQTSNPIKSTTLKDTRHKSVDNSEDKPFIMDVDNSSESENFVVSLSCAKCSFVVHSSYKDDKVLREKRKQSKRCVCLTLTVLVVICLSFLASLSYLTISVMSLKSGTDNQDSIQEVTPQNAFQHKTHTGRHDFKSGLTKFELDVPKLDPQGSKAIPWKLTKDGNLGIVYHETNYSISVSEAGEYLIQVTLSADTHLYPNDSLVTIHPCLVYKNNDKCQRLKIPGGMAMPIHFQDIVRLDAGDSMMVTVLPKTDCIYTSALYNTLTIVRLRHTH